MQIAIPSLVSLSYGAQGKHQKPILLHKFLKASFDKCALWVKSISIMANRSAFYCIDADVFLSYHRRKDMLHILKKKKNDGVHVCGHMCEGQGTTCGSQELNSGWKPHPAEPRVGSVNQL